MKIFIALLISAICANAQIKNVSSAYAAAYLKAPAGGTTLKTGLVAYWSLDGVLTDSHGTNTLVGNVGLTYTTGIVHSQAKTNGSRVTGPIVSYGANQPWTMMVWVKPRVGFLGNKNIIGRYNPAEPQLYLRDADRFRCNPGGADYYVPGQIQSNTWYCVVGGYDGSAYWITADNGTRATITTTCPAGTAEFSIDADADHIIGPGAYWTKSLTATEVGLLYNSGAGLPYSSW